MDDILKSINTEDTWVDVQTVAALKNITQRAIRLAIRQDKYIANNLAFGDIRDFLKKYGKYLQHKLPNKFDPLDLVDGE